MRVVALLLAAVTALVLASDALGPFVSSGAPLSASAMRTALDGRSEAVAAVREQVIDVRRKQVALRDRVYFMELSVDASMNVSDEAARLEVTDVDPWAEAGIVPGQVANADALNEVFERFVEDAANIRAFQGLLILDQAALFGRVEALEAVAGILDPPSAAPLAPNDDAVSVPHTFTAGSPMRASEMNANLVAVDVALTAEAEMASAIAAGQAVLEMRIDALEAEFGQEPLFTWRIGTYDWGSGVSTESHFIFRNLGTFEPFTITVTGPEGYERDLTVTNQYAASTGWTDSLLPSGTYTATTTYGGVEFALPIAYDETSRIDRPDLSLGATTTSSISFTVSRVDATAVYDLRLIEQAGPYITGTHLAPFAESSQFVQFTGLDLDPSRSYYVFAATATVVDPWSPTLVPQQVDRGVTTTAAFVPTTP